MTAAQSAETTAPVSDATELHTVNRAIAELRRGGCVLLRDATGTTIVVSAAEGISAPQIARQQSLLDAPPVLVVSRNRAAALGVALSADDGDVVALDIAGCPAERILALADPVVLSAEVTPIIPRPRPRGTLPNDLDHIAVDLMKLAGLLPAAVAGLYERTGPAPLGEPQAVPVVDTEDVGRFRQEQALSLHEVSAARVPLALAEDTRIVVFRTADGVAEHLAIVVGQPEPDRPVLTRLHSQCMTGDLLGSLRCDCGDQLRAAIAAIAEAGSGVLLYLAQEGRGIGLANKLRAYALQDRGADTVDANHQLGFDADERLYLAAAAMLRRLGFSQVRLLTNNPRKVSGLSGCGVSVAERVPLVVKSNDFNVDYLEAKARRLGHLF
jgi:GTP cyclohydrolase II